MASPFPNIDVGDIVDVSLIGGGLLNDWEITYVPENSPGNANSFFWELKNPETGDIAIINQFSAMKKRA